MKPIFVGALLMLSAIRCWPQDGNSASPQKPSALEIVDRMQRRDRIRAEALIRYRSIRHYTVEYHGFPKSLAATMDVEMTFDPVTGKSFRILSLSGSTMLCEKVLKRAIESESEASLKKNESALTNANYRFESLGSESVNGRPTYVLRASPIRSGKFLYQGKIRIDAADSALESIDAQPAKNPSFWISKTEIHQQYVPVDGFWLPRSNRSATRVRFGGTAVLTIDYGTYTIEHR